jgi:hypothetical protein
MKYPDEVQTYVEGVSDEAMRKMVDKEKEREAIRQRLSRQLAGRSPEERSKMIDVLCMMAPVLGIGPPGLDRDGLRRWFIVEFSE